ncbi:MAG: TonB family protein [Terriglobales bacterium]
MAQPLLSSDSSIAPDLSALPAERTRDLRGHSSAPDSEHVLAQLRTAISADFSLDAVLQHIVEAALKVTSADGAAIALRRDNSVICQARAGNIAPELGSELDTNSGISGQCLRSGRAQWCNDTNNDERVDAEVCRRLGLRSIAVVPMGRKPDVSGVLEIFSALPFAFRDIHLELLEELAEFAIAAERRSVESVAPRTRIPRIPGKFAHLIRPLWPKYGLILVAAVAILALLGWRVFPKKPATFHLAVAVPPQPITHPIKSPAVDASPVVLSAHTDRARAADDPETKAVLPPGVVIASKRDKVVPTDDVTVWKLGRERASNQNEPVHALVKPATSRPQNPVSTAAIAPALAAVSSTSEAALGSLLSSSNNMPRRAIRVSQGISGGVIEHRVDPIYPRQAFERKIAGRVLLQALVTQDGTLRDLKVLQGEPRLARAAMEAVSQWRYQPYRLNGVPISMSTQITIVFKLP